MKCPSCHGKCRMHAFVDGSSGSGMIWLLCDRCKGQGEVPDEMTQWIEDGKKMRARRIHSPDGFRTLVEESERRGIPLVDLSRMERGEIKPILEDAK